VEVFRAFARDGGAVPDAGTLAVWIATAREAWPHIDLPDERFVLHLARHAPADLASPPNVVDLYLACACVEGNPQALAELDARYIVDIGRAIWQVGDGDRDDVLQRVREKLLVGGGGEPMIARYAGRGALRVWVRSVVVRTAIKQARSTAGVAVLDDEGFLELAASSDDPSLEVFKRRYRGEFREAFRTAVAQLSVRHRNLLRQYFIDHMTIDELGVLYRVHRATAARWIGDVRAELVHHVRHALDGSLAKDDLEMRNLIELVASQLELSLERLVAIAS
jgi:RNA polymerase sigma-70 factor (ECF subfamily)